MMHLLFGGIYCIRVFKHRETGEKEKMVHLLFRVQGSRLTFQLSSLVASERFDFTSQNKFSVARLFCTISYCVQCVQFLAELSTVNMPFCNL